MHDIRQRKLQLNGFTLIEALVFLFLFTVITTVFFQTFAYGTALIQQSKYRLGATSLANQKMEIIRSLDYDNIGTLSGIPAGDIQEDETVQVNNSVYHVHTFIQYVDDAYDGQLGHSPNDPVPNDYKRVRVEVAWGTESDSEKIALFSTFTPPGIEQTAGGGVLSINILDSQGNGVSGASLHITNSTVSPAVNVTTTTDASGNVYLIGAKASVQGYHISFSKGGYFGSQTYAPYPTTSFIPTDVHASVVNSAVNQTTFIIDRSSTLRIMTEDSFGNAIPDIEYRIDGGRQLGSAAGSGASIYEFGVNDTTNASGEKNYTNRSYGSYTWIMDSSETNYEFIRLDPGSNASANSFELAPGVTQNEKAVLADKAVNGVLFTVTNDDDGTPLNAASVRLTNTALVYDETVVAGYFGKAYFSTNAAPGLVAGTYNYEVTAAGYTTEAGTVTVTSGLKLQSVSMDPS